MLESLENEGGGTFWNVFGGRLESFRKRGGEGEGLLKSFEKGGRG